MTRVGAGAREVLHLAGTSFWRGFLNFYDSDNLTYAASIAYYALLSLFPFFLLAFALLGRATADAADRNAVFAFVLRYFPEQFDFVAAQLESFRTSQFSLGVAGTVTLVWGALGFFGAISTAVNYAWGVDEQPSFWKHKLLSFVMLGVAGGLLLLGLLLVSASQVAGAGWFAHVVVRFPGLLVLRSVTVRHATTLIFIVVVGFVFYFVPNATVRFRDVWLGAAVTGLLWKGALEGFAWYVRDMSRFTLVNGSIAAVVIFLVWVYLQAVILLYGVEFTAAYARLRRGRPDDVPAAPSPRT